jgi:hypothetical protein
MFTGWLAHIRRCSNMRFICVASANLRLVDHPKILECIVVGLAGLGDAEVSFSKSAAQERISLITRRCISADAVGAQHVRAMAEGDDVLTFVNKKLRDVTNVGKLKCFS